MKYLRSFENMLEISDYTEDFPNSLINLIKLYLNDFNITVDIVVKDNGDITIHFFYNFENFLDIFYEVSLNLSIRFDYLYTYIEIWKKLYELRHYLHDLIKPLCFEYDGNSGDDTYEYLISMKNKEKLLSLLTPEEYKIKIDTNKYNL